MIGSRFGGWVVVAFSHKKRSGPYYLCKCDCGTERIVFRGNLKSGKTRSCGCLVSTHIAENATKHGHAKTSSHPASPTYSSWSSMLTRCYNEKSKTYKNYGGRGISVCERWHTFLNFLDDMGEKPEKGMSIERINNDGNYEKSNCKWATTKEQNRNKRSVILNESYVRKLRAGIKTSLDASNETGCTIRAANAARLGQNWKEL